MNRSTKLLLLPRFDVYDSDGASPNLDDHDFIGSMECSLGEVVSHQGKGLTRHLIGWLHHIASVVANALSRQTNHALQ